MSAKNGSAVKRSRLIGCTVAAMFALTALFASSASAVNPPVEQTYLALGDSLAFGYSQQLFNENLTTGEPATAFEHGYVNNYFNHLKPKLTGTQLQNLGCPGETTDSLVGNGPLGSAIDPEHGESACGYHKAGPPLHNEYGGGKSQLERALELLAVDAISGKPVTTLSLNIGANDQLHAVAKCEAQAKAEVGAKIKAKIEQEIGEKLAKGEIAPEEIPAFVAKRSAEEAANPANKVAGEKIVQLCIANAAPALGKYIGEKIGTILYVLRKGAEFGSVNYTGKVVFVGAYNPYGNLLAFPSKKELTEGVNDELLPGSNFLVSSFNAGFKGAVETFGGCFADTKPKFNPQNLFEPARLQKYTNMANMTESNGKKNGPDIHPTPTGYKVMNSEIVAACG
jgi:lysophospholipase L1-like esterase